MRKFKTHINITYIEVLAQFHSIVEMYSIRKYSRGLVQNKYIKQWSYVSLVPTRI